VTLPTTGTIVLYPSGATTSESTVVHVEPQDDGRLAILLDRTAAHPVDATWPDQGPDRGLFDAGDVVIPLVDVLVGATDGENLFLGSNIPVRKGTDGWTFVVAHLVAEDAGLTEGDTVTVEVDAGYRTALSTGHTGCHLASLALNQALFEVDAWSKAVPLDAAGSPNFDALAIETTTITEYGSLDVYRIGKSLRKKGFDPSGLADPGAIEGRANDLLAGWVAGGGGIHIDRDGEGLTDRRYWVCELPEGDRRIPCGGTHAASLADFASVRVTLVPEPAEGAIGLVMTTVVTPAVPPAVPPV
jgi:alanyl-tRNA synthetase